MNKYNELPQLPKIEKNKLIILLNQNAVRDTNFISLFEKPRDIYLFSILLHNEIIRTKENRKIEMNIKELQETYKIFRGESKYDLMDFLNQINNEIFSYFVLDKENEILTYNIKPDYFDTNSNTFFVNICLLKGLKINSQKIALYLISMGPHAKYLHLSHIAKLLDIDDKSQKLKQKSANTAIETLSKNNFIKDTNYDRSKKKFYFKMEDIKLKGIIQDLNFD
ncbi:hypothetical protein [Vibrio parahaemolyticus]|uniref:hypothetical protein n=1 Tax=Vibrio parahaemolyticus TaxID=670 RepID=UPI000BE29A68|nr:hypothetical protein [Vibrio parahaemolyticus]ATI47108.1 hypothetical protein CO725_16250 [Vibrio parahaemolyticus]